MTNSTEFVAGPLSLISDSHRMFASALYRRLKAEGIPLTRSQWRTLTHLKLQDGLSQSELAERLWMEKAPLGTLLDKLEAAGLIERRSAPHDRRVRLVYVTPKAEPLLPLIEQQISQLRDNALQGLSTDEQAEFTRLLSKVHGNMLEIRQRDRD